jgi:rhamnosyltransferase
MKKSILENLPLIVVGIAIALFGTIFQRKIGILNFELRVEDVLLLDFGILWIFNFIFSKDKKIKRFALFKPILIWLAIGIFSVSYNLIFSNLKTAFGIAYFLKELEFLFIFGFIYFQIKNLESAKLVIKLWIIFMAIHMSWIIFELISGIKYSYYYGPNIYIEPDGPYPSASFLLLSFAFLSNIFIFHYLSSKIEIYKKVIMGIIVASLIFGIMVSGSSTNFVALFAILFLTALIYFIKEKKYRFLLVSVCGLGVITMVSLLSIDFFVSQFWGAVWEYTSSQPDSRMGILKDHLKSIFNSAPQFLIFGHGIWGDCHGQYIRIILERGVIGFLAFIFLMGAMLKSGLLRVFSNKSDTFLTGTASGLLMVVVGMLVISIPADPFMTVKVAEVFWFFVALSFGIFKLYNCKSDFKVFESIGGEKVSLAKQYIVAVVISHEPDEEFRNNIDSIKHQVDKVIIINNGSAKLKEMESLFVGQNIVFIHNTENVGQGKALNQGVGYAISAGYKWVLLLDQDSRLDSLMVSKQIEVQNSIDYKEKLGVIGSNCVYSGLRDIKYALECQNGRTYFEREVVMTSGMLLSLKTYEEVGHFRENFFIDSIDVDYCLRLRKAGFKVYVACKAMMTHTVGKDAFFVDFLGKKIMVTNHNAQRCYYMARNGTIMIQEYFFSETYWVFRRIVWHFFVKPLFILLYENDKWNKIKATLKGILDGFIKRKEYGQ